jgi:ATP-dependent DNA helicase RecG
VVVRLPTEPADLDFRRLVVEEERRRSAELPIDSLIALAAVRGLKRVTADELAERIQRDAASAKRTLEALTEVGLVEAHGNTRGRSYTLSAAVYRQAGDKAGYVRQAGFTTLQNEQMVLRYVRQHGQIRRAEVMALCRLSEGQAKELIRKLKERGELVQHGERRAAYYTAGP